MKTIQQLTARVAMLEQRLRHMEVSLMKMQNQQFDWCEAQVVCNTLGISKRTLARYRERKIIVAEKFGGKYMYDLPGVQRMLSEKKHQQLESFESRFTVL